MEVVCSGSKKNDPRPNLLKAIKEIEANKEIYYVSDNAKFDNDFVELEAKHSQVWDQSN